MNNFLGKIKVRLVGVNVERDISRALKAGIKLNRVTRKDALGVVVELGAIGYFRLKRMKKACEMQFVSANGLIGLARRPLRSLGALAVVIAVAAGAAILGGSFLLDVKIDGNETISAHEVLSELKSDGVDAPCVKSQIDLESIEKSLKIRFSQIDLVKAYYYGSTLHIDIIEGSPAPDIEAGEPSDIIAMCDGVIEKATVKSGKSCVKEYQTVKQGDVLVKGCYVKNETSYSVHSRASITARVDYTEIAELDAQNSVRSRTGRKTLLKYLKIGKIWVKINGENPYESYDAASRLCGVVGENMPLSIKLYDVSCYETLASGKLDDSTAAIRAKESAYYSALSRMPEDAEVLSVTSRVFADDKDKKYAAVTVTVLQEIGIQAAPTPAEEEDIG